MENNSQQLKMNDSMINMSEGKITTLMKSWAKGFSDIVFPAINEKRFSVLYSNNTASRPNVPVNMIIGALILKEMFGFTDEELIEQMTFNVQFQFALHATSYEEAPLSGRTLTRFRTRVYDYAMEHDGHDLIHAEICMLAEVFGKYMGVNKSVVRMDSAMISSSCRRLSRLSLMFLTVRGMVERMRKSGAEIPEEFIQYQKDSTHDDIGYRLKKDEIRMKMEEVLRDALKLAELCVDQYSETDEYRRLLRMVDDQSKEVENGRELKENTEILPTSMQNPSDEDATYRKKSGKEHVGYVANFQEAVSDNGGIITDYDLQKNNYSDIRFGKDVIEELPEEGETEVIITDGAFASAETLKLAEDKGVKLAATTLSGGVVDDFEAKFEIDEETNNVSGCPAGHAPNDSKYDEKNSTYSAHFDKETCENCPFCDRCPGVFQTKFALIKFSSYALARAEYYLKMNTEEYKEYANIRNGVEGIPSVLRRRYGVDNMPVRGLLRSKIWLGFKIGAMNTVSLLKAVATALFFAFLCSIKLLFRIYFPSHSRLLQLPFSDSPLNIPFSPLLAALS